MVKKRANGEGNIRKRADGRWEGRYTAGYHPETGKRIIKNVLGKTQAECKAKLKKAIEESQSLDIGRADACVTGKPAAYQYARTKGGLKVLPEQLTTEEYGIAVRKDLTELTKGLNDALAKVKADGTYDKIVAKWFPNK